MTIDTPRGPFVCGRVPMPATRATAVERALSMASWAAEQGDAEAEAFYAQRAADLRARVVGSEP